MCGECGPCALDFVLYLCGFLVHECDHLCQILFHQEEESPRASGRFQLLLFCNCSVCQHFGSLGGFRVPALLHFFEVPDHCLSCFKEAAIMSTSSAKRRFDMQSLFSSLSLMPKPLSFQVSLSLSIADWRTELKTTWFCPTSDAVFITFHISQYGGTLISV